MEEKKQNWVDSLLVYKDVRMVRILLLGAISGFPWVLIASSLSLWLKEEGMLDFLVNNKKTVKILRSGNLPEVSFAKH